MHEHTGVSGVDTLGLALRLLLLLTTAVVAGTGFLRPFVTARPRLTVAVSSIAAALGSGTLLLSIVLRDVSVPFAVTHVLLLIAVPAVLSRPTLSCYLSLLLGILLLVETSDGRDSPGLGPLVIAAAAVAAITIIAGFLRRASSSSVYRAGAATAAAALLAFSALQALPRPAEHPKPGTALIAQASAGGHTIPVLVTPQRPGQNLVHFPENAGDSIEVAGTGAPVRATRRPGANGTWAEVNLPAGHSELIIRHGSAEGSVEVDTGTGSTVPGSTGEDGPECASAAVAASLAGSRDTVRDCPSQHLSAQDADALEKVVAFISSQSPPGLTLAGDESPRAKHAAEVVFAAAEKRHIPVHTTPSQGDALLVVSGWAQAQRQLDAARGQQDQFTYGVYLAPWLLNAPLTNSVATASVPLRFDPRDNRSLQYGMTLDAAFSGDAPSVAGFQAWLAAHGQELTDPVSIYAAAQVDVMKMDMPGMRGHNMHGSTATGQWNPHGTVVAISNPLHD